MLATSATAKSVYTITSNTATAVPTNTYVAYAAQPFLNEVAGMLYDDGSGRKIQDFGLEFAVPAYTLPKIAVQNWRVRIDNVLWVPDLSSGAVFAGALNTSAGVQTAAAARFAFIETGGQYGDLFTGANYNPPTQYKDTVVYPDASVSATATDPPGSDGTAHTITLERPYYNASTAGPQSTSLQYIVVDKFQYQFAVPADTNGYNETNERNNYNTAGTFAPWVCTSPQPISVAAGSSKSIPYDGSSDPCTLGSLNPINATSAVLYGLHIPDFYADTDWTAAAAPTASPIIGASGGTAPYVYNGNINDFNLHYQRVTSMTGTAYTATNGLPITDIMADLNSSPFKELDATQTGAVLPQEGKFYFDYRADPRAQRLLQLLSTVDRASDGTDQLGAGTADTLDEVRLPGRVNVNTASDQVLAALPNMTVALVANIHAYRDRLNGYTNASLTGCTTATNYSTYPGMGIRSMWRIC